MVVVQYQEVLLVIKVVLEQNKLEAVVLVEYTIVVLLGQVLLVLVLQEVLAEADQEQDQHLRQLLGQAKVEMQVLEQIVLVVQEIQMELI